MDVKAKLILEIFITRLTLVVLERTTRRHREQSMRLKVMPERKWSLFWANYIENDTTVFYLLDLFTLLVPSLSQRNDAESSVCTFLKDNRKQDFLHQVLYTVNSWSCHRHTFFPTQIYWVTIISQSQCWQLRIREKNIYSACSQEALCSKWQRKILEKQPQIWEEGSKVSIQGIAHKGTYLSSVVQERTWCLRWNLKSEKRVLRWTVGHRVFQTKEGAHTSRSKTK